MAATFSPSTESFVVYAEPSEPTEEGIPMQTIATFPGADNPDGVLEIQAETAPTNVVTIVVQKRWTGQGCGMTSIMWKQGEEKKDVWGVGIFPTGIPYDIWIKYMRRELLSALSFACTKTTIRKWWRVESATKKGILVLPLIIALAFTLVADIFLLLILLIRGILFPITLLTFGPFALCNNHESIPVCSGRWWCVWSSLWMLGATGWGFGAIFLKPCSFHSPPTDEDREIDWCC